MDPVHSLHAFFGNGPEDYTCDLSVSEVFIDEFNVSSSFKVGLPFHVTHRLTDIGPVSSCHNSYLALGLRGGTISRRRMNGVKYLYILQYNEYCAVGTCNHAPELDRDACGAPWRAVAFLAGWRQNRGTMGSVLEISPGGNRIASAAWDSVLVWTFDPTALQVKTLKDYFPPRDYSARKRQGRLRPIMLPRQGVVHTMKWTDDNTLYALTDRGLVRWYIGPGASGKRDIDPVIRTKA